MENLSLGNNKNGKAVRWDDLRLFSLTSKYGKSFNQLLCPYVPLLVVWL